MRAAEFRIDPSAVWEGMGLPSEARGLLGSTGGFDLGGVSVEALFAVEPRGCEKGGAAKAGGIMAVSSRSTRPAPETASTDAMPKEPLGCRFGKGSACRGACGGDGASVGLLSLRGGEFCKRFCWAARVAAARGPAQAGDVPTIGDVFSNAPENKWPIVGSSAVGASISSRGINGVLFSTPTPLFMGDSPPPPMAVAVIAV